MNIPKVAWFSFFPIEWLPDIPEELRGIPKDHPATWQRVLVEQFEKRRCVNLHVLSLRKTFPRDSTFERNGVTYHCIKTRGGFRAPSLFWSDTLLISRLLKKIQPDLVHAWGTEFGSAAVAARLPYKSLVTMQGILRWYAEMFPVRGTHRISKFLECGSLKRARFVTTESTAGMRYLKQHYPHLQLFQVEHAPSAMFFDVPRKPEPARLLFVGSFDTRKGTDILFRALDALRDEFVFELKFVGGRNPELETELRGATSAELWKRVEFKGHLNSREISEELSRATALILPTRADTSPNSVKEAVVVGVPVVASAMGGINDYVLPGKNGYLFEPGSLQGCIQALRDLFGDPEMRAGKVDPGTHARMREYLSPELMADKFLAAYQAVLAG